MGVVIRQSIKATVVNYVGVFIGFLVQMFVVVKFLPQEVFGLTSVLLNAALMFCSFAQLGAGSSIVRFFPYFKDQEKKHNGFFFYLVTVPLIGTLVFGALFLLLKKPVTDYFQANSELFVDYYYWVLPLGCFLLYTAVFETYSAVLMRIAMPKLVKEIFLRVLLAAVYILYGFRLITLSQFIACFVGVYGAAMLAIFYYVSRIGPVSLKHDPAFVGKKLRKDFFSYTSLIVIGSLGGTLISKVDTFMVSSNLGLEYAAVYTLAFYMVAVIEIPSRSISTISGPVASEALKKGDFRKANALYKQVSLHQLVAGSLIFLLVWINIDNIYAIIPNGAAYRAGKWVFFFVGLAKLVEVTLSFGGTLISYTKYYHWTIYFAFFITALTIFSNNLLIPIYGVLGAALATTITCLVSYGLQQWIIFIKIKGNPYTVGTLKQIALILLLSGINWLLPTLGNPWLDAIFRSSVIVAVGLPLLYVFKVSQEVNKIIAHIFRLYIFPSKN